MTNSNHTMKHVANSRWAVCSILAAVMLLGTFAADNASAANSYSLNFNSSEQLLANPNDAMVMHFESWDSPLLRRWERNTPWIEVNNDSDSMQNLTEISFDMPEGYVWSDIALGAAAILSSTTPGVSLEGNIITPETLSVSFLNGGLAPGETARFRVDIDLAPGEVGFIHPDYRNVFFDSDPTDTVDDDLGLAATFGTGADAVLLEGRLGALNVPLTGFVEGNLRPYSIMEMVETFPDITPDGGPDPVIPEPSTGILALLCLAGLVGGRRRS